VSNHSWLEETDAASPRVPPVRVILLWLLAAGVVMGLVMGGAVWAFTAVAQNGPTLAIGRVEQLARVDLPEGTRVIDSRLEQTDSAQEFSAEVRLPDGAALQLGEPLYWESDAWPDWVASLGDRLSDVAYYEGDSDDPAVQFAAATGVDADGRTVIVFESATVDGP
jgi:hypothetical protein